MHGICFEFCGRNTTAIDYAIVDCALDEATKDLLKLAMTDLNFSARACDRILKVARTIADLADADSLSANQVSEAIQYGSLDRQIGG